MLMVLGAFTAFAQTNIPDTPAGQTLSAWLDAINGGDDARIATYIKTHDPGSSADFFHNFRSQTGGFNLLAIESSEPLHIRFRVQEKASTTQAVGNILLDPAEPHLVKQFGLRAIPPGGKVENVTLDGPARHGVIDGISALLEEFYIYTEGAQKMTDGLRAHLKAGDYDKITDGDAFASQLTTDLVEVSHDHHLRVTFSPVKLPPDSDGQQGPTSEQLAAMSKQMMRDNCGFRKAEYLPGNIGYLKLDFFGDPDVCGPTLVAAMNFLANADAIIFDLRENVGGDPRMVALVCTYLFDKSTHLNDLYFRKENETTQYWTLSYVPGPRMPKIPAFVLTSLRTFSGGEEFTNDLKTQKRATIVGEATGGGAHPVAVHRVDDHFMIGVPDSRPINPITKTDWEGTGVTPDVAVDADSALETAQKLAADRIDADRKASVGKNDTEFKPASGKMTPTNPDSN
jgi:hypothetical protein